MPTDRQQPLADFVNWVKANVAGDEKGEAQIFLDRLSQALGPKRLHRLPAPAARARP